MLQANEARQRRTREDTPIGYRSQSRLQRPSSASSYRRSRSQSPVTSSVAFGRRVPTRPPAWNNVDFITTAPSSTASQGSSATLSPSVSSASLQLPSTSTKIHKYPSTANANRNHNIDRISTPANLYVRPSSHEDNFNMTRYRGRSYGRPQSTSSRTHSTDRHQTHRGMTSWRSNTAASRSDSPPPLEEFLLQHSKSIQSTPLPIGERGSVEYMNEEYIAELSKYNNGKISDNERLQMLKETEAIRMKNRNNIYLNRMRSSQENIKPNKAYSNGVPSDSMNIHVDESKEEIMNEINFNGNNNMYLLNNISDAANNRGSTDILVDDAPPPYSLQQKNTTNNECKDFQRSSNHNEDFEEDDDNMNVNMISIDNFANNKYVDTSKRKRRVWKEYRDKTTNQYYYHNRLTGVTTWEKPSDSDMKLKFVTAQNIRSEIL